jgi:hypothetical protein
MQIPRMCFIFTVAGPPLARKLLLEPPPGWAEKPDLARLLSLLEGTEWQGSRRQAEAELKRKIEAMCRALPWPRLALVTDQPGGGEPVCDDPLVWCVAATKRTGRIVLLDREPNIDRLRGAGPMVLHFPERRCME